MKTLYPSLLEEELKPGRNIIFANVDTFVVAVASFGLRHQCVFVGITSC
jgi:hypothetical protein